MLYKNYWQNTKVLEVIQLYNFFIGTIFTLFTLNNENTSYS